MSEQVVFKRKFHWTIEGQLPDGPLEPFFVRIAARPTLRVEETEVPGLAGTFVPGKAEWEDLIVTATEVPDAVWKTIGSFVPTKEGSFKLTMYSGCGEALEEWELTEAQITNTSCGATDAEFHIQFKKARYKLLTLE